MLVISKEAPSLKKFKAMIDVSAADAKKDMTEIGVKVTHTPAERIALLDDAVVVFEMFKRLGSPSGINFAKSLPADGVEEYLNRAEEIVSGINGFLSQEDDPKTLFAAMKLERSEEDGTSSELTFALSRNTLLEGEDGFHAFLENVEAFKKTVAQN